MKKYFVLYIFILKIILNEKIWIIKLKIIIIFYNFLIYIFIFPYLCVNYLWISFYIFILNRSNIDKFIKYYNYEKNIMIKKYKESKYKKCSKICWEKQKTKISKFLWHFKNLFIFIYKFERLKKWFFQSHFSSILLFVLTNSQLIF